MLLLTSVIIVFLCIVGALAFSLWEEAKLAERSRMLKREFSDGGQAPVFQIVRAERDNTGALAGGIYVLLLLLVSGLIVSLTILLVPSAPGREMRPDNLLMLALFGTIIPLLYSNARQSFAFERLIAQLPPLPSLRLYHDRIAIPANFVLAPDLFLALNSPEVVLLLSHIKGWHLGLARDEGLLPLLRLDCGSNLRISIVATYLDGKEQDLVALLRELGVPEETVKHER
jgi:hypothetical protein